LVEFQQVDAAKFKKSYTDADGKDITHIYSYNKVMSPEDAKSICETLNRTDFRVLAWYMSPENSKKAGLKNVQHVHTLPMQSTGQEKFSAFFYIKDRPSEPETKPETPGLRRNSSVRSRK
jgi:hypothetical protein